MSLPKISASHITALSKFYGVRALTELSLARALNTEKAVARHALAVLVEHELLKRYANVEYAINKKGIDLLASLGVIEIPSIDEKPKRKPDPQPEPKPVEVTPAPSDPFSLLVRKGLDRLNKQLNHQHLIVEDRELKISTLTDLADTLDGFDASISTILRKIAIDLK